MKYENYSDTKENKEPTQEELNEAKEREFDEKVKRRGSLSANEKQDLLKEIKERNFSRGLPTEATKEEAEIEIELDKKKEDLELQPEKKVETNNVNDTSEDLDKELDDELHKYFSQQKEEQKNKLKKEIDSLDEKFDEIMRKASKMEGDIRPEDTESLKKSETKKEDRSPEERKRLLVDSIAERKDAMEKIKKIGESSDLDVSGPLSDIQKEIEKLEKQVG